MRAATCFECQQPTSKDESRIVWLKDQGIERRLCRACLKRRGLHLLARPWREGRA